MFERSFLKSRIAAATVVAFVFSGVVPASASTHLPTISIQPTLIYATSDNIHPAPYVAPVNGNLVLNGSITFPIIAGATISYDHYTNGLIYGTIPRIISGGKYVNSPLEFRDLVDTFRLDAPLFKGVGAELGTAYRHRTCCPGDTDPTNSNPTFYHDNYLGLNYTSPAFAVLHGTRFIYGITGHASPHNSDNAAAVAASVAAGYSAKRTQYGITQAITAAIPVDPKHGFSVAGTYTWGAFNYFSNLVYPLYYGIYIVNMTKRVNKYVDIVANLDNFVQRPQGYPLGPAGDGVLQDASLNVGLNLHFGP